MGQHMSKVNVNKLCKCGPPINVSVKGGWQSQGK